MSHVSSISPMHSQCTISEQLTVQESLQAYLQARMLQHGEKVALVDSLSGEFVTFAALLVRAAALAAGLQSRGLQEGDVALLVGENDPNYPWALLALLKAGAVPHLINPASTKREMEHALSLSNPKVALVSAAASNYEEWSSALWECESLQHVLAYGASTDKRTASDLPAGVFCLMQSSMKWRERGINTQVGRKSNFDRCECVLDVDSSGLVSISLVHCRREPPPRQELPDVALLISSSGTMDLPKVAMFTTAGCLAALRQGSPFFSAESIIAGTAPFSHVFGHVVLMQSLCGGHTLVTARRLSLDGLVDAVERLRVTTITLMVPSLLSALIRHPGWRSGMLAHVTRIVTHGAAMPPDILPNIRRAMPAVRLYNAYALTEMIFAPMFSEMSSDKAGSVGKLLPGIQCQVRDLETGEEVPIGSHGEICVQSPMVMAGYLGDPEATTEVLDSDGWLHTGDIGFVDRDGYYFLIDRITNVFQNYGRQVSPMELEAVLETHLGVREAAVLGVPHLHGSNPLAMVVRAHGPPVSERVLKRFVAARVDPHKQLLGGVRFVKALAKTSSGKLQRRKLRHLLFNCSDVTSGTEPRVRMGAFHVQSSL